MPDTTGKSDVPASETADEARCGTSAPADNLDALLSKAPSGPVAVSGDRRTDARASLSDDALGDA